MLLELLLDILAGETLSAAARIQKKNSDLRISETITSEPSWFRRKCKKPSSTLSSNLSMENREKRLHAEGTSLKGVWGMLPQKILKF